MSNLCVCEEVVCEKVMCGQVVCGQVVCVSKLCVCVAGGRDGRGGTGRAGRKYTKMWRTRANRRFDEQIDGKSEMRYSDVNCAVNGRFLKQT